MLGAVLLGLGSSAAWGAADFLGGLKSRDMPLLAVLFGSQASGLLLLLPMTVVTHGMHVVFGTWTLLAVLAGIASIVSLAALYEALSIGVMTIASPISATSPIVPVAYALATGHSPGLQRLVGVSLSIAGIMLLSAGPRRKEQAISQPPTRAIGLALLAALAGGCFFLCMHEATQVQFLPTVFAQRLTSTVLVIAGAVAGRHPVLLRRVLFDPAVIGTGFMDVGGTVLYAAASTMSSSVIAAVAALYPIPTLILAAFFLRERVGNVQKAGVAVALGGVALISA